MKTLEALLPALFARVAEAKSVRRRLDEAEAIPDTARLRIGMGL